MRSINYHQNITIFAPSNAAWDVPEVKRILQDKHRVEEILNLHLVKEPLPLNVIRQKSGRQVSNVYKYLHIFLMF